MDSVLKFKIAFPFIFLVAGILAVRSFNYGQALTPSEKRIISFRADEALLQKRRERTPVMGDLKSPIEFSRKSGFPPAPLAQVAPRQEEPEAAEPEFKVSMIVVGSSSNMAIVNGQVVKEGDLVDNFIVKKIEKGRVFLTESAGRKGRAASKWVYLEDVKR